MRRRLFTVEEANEALATVRPLAENMVDYRRRLARAEERRATLSKRIGANGGDLAPSDLAEVQGELETAAAGVARSVAAIQERGVLVKDLDRGLLDFPARRGDEEVLLCWHVGEDEIRYWHGVDEGFAGRKEL